MLQFDLKFIKEHLLLNCEFQEKISALSSWMLYWLFFNHWRNGISVFITGRPDSQAALIFNSIASEIQCLWFKCKNVHKQITLMICLPVRLQRFQVYLISSWWWSLVGVLQLRRESSCLQMCFCVEDPRSIMEIKEWRWRFWWDNAPFAPEKKINSSRLSK